MLEKELEFGQKHVLVNVGPLHRIGRALYIGKTGGDYAFLAYNGKIKCYHVENLREFSGELWIGPFPAKEVALTEQEEELSKQTWRRYMKNAADKKPLC